MPGQIAMLALALALLAPGAAHAVAARFQDATDATSLPCILPEPVPLPRFIATPLATPVAVASPVPEQPADPTTAAALERVVRVLAACLTAGKSETVAQLVTERYLGATYGDGGRLSRDAYVELTRELPAIPVAVLGVAEARLETPQRATAEVITVVGNQLARGRWRFVLVEAGETEAAIATAEPKGRWLVDSVKPLPIEPPAGAVQIDVVLDDYAFAVTPRRVSGSDLILAGKNTSTQDHEMLVLRLDRGMRTDILLREPGPGLPPGVTFVGQLTVPAGRQGDLVLVGLAPGNYSLVCLLPDAEGTPHLALGMQARLSVREPTADSR